MRNLFSNSLEDNLENTVFLYIKPVDIEQKRINMQKIASVIKSVPRSSDIVAHGKGSGFYLILYNSGVAGAKSVVSRVKNKLANICKIYANAAQITASFEEMEPVLYSSMNDQISAAKEFNFLNELNITNTIEVMDITDENGKKLKDFKKEFFDNFEKIVAPVFFRMQTTYNESFPESEIKFNISETQSSFYIAQNNIKSELLITYPSYIKIIFDIIQTKENETPEARRTVLDFEDFSEEKITLIIQDMINDFINKLNAENIKIPE
ncbi:MAG: hypothetical protein LUG16_04205 [Candidatus Gastranaerophilales bacterium]|nr:hypothetical protein [Candidatus Gastranaerophilales bacterium]